MNIYLSSTGDLYHEHRRTQSPKKKAKIAAELQRRHDQQYGGSVYCWRFYGGPGVGWYTAFRYDFALCL